MTKEHLQAILENVWLRDWSADDAFEAIWGEPFDNETQFIPTEEVLSSKTVDNNSLIV